MSDARAVGCATLCALGLAWGAARADCGVPEPSPQQELGALYGAVEQQSLFADDKVFADALPREDPSRIVRAYEAGRPATRAALAAFVRAHFTLPAPATQGSARGGPGPLEPLVAHIDRLWPLLTRRTPAAPQFSSLIAVPAPYVVPGGRFRELYYWDSYFTMLGLAASGRRDLIASMVDDFAHLIDRYGHVPNGTRTYYLSRSQPPFFFAMVALTRPDDPPAADARYLKELRAEYAYWMRGAARLHAGEANAHVVSPARGVTLNRYWDECDLPRDESYRGDVELARAHPRTGLYRELRAAAESGWDFSSRWFADGATRATLETTELAPVDLNALLYGLEQAIGAGCKRRGVRPCTREFALRAAARRAALDRYLWDAPSGRYLDAYWRSGARSARASAAMLYPLFVRAASPAQAQGVARAVASELLAPGGLVTTPRTTGEQWDAPQGWAPLQWLAIEGLRAYAENALATQIACRWMRSVARHYERSGALVEKYDVEHPGVGGGGGEYPLQDGFGWTNGVMRSLVALYPEEAVHCAPGIGQ
jgi:alpha,alpha-trehalase